MAHRVNQVEAIRTYYFLNPEVGSRERETSLSCTVVQQNQLDTIVDFNRQGRVHVRGQRKDGQTDNMQKHGYGQSPAKVHHESGQGFRADQHISFFERNNAISIVDQNKQNATQKRFRASERAMNRPECDNDQDEAEIYLLSDLSSLSKNVKKDLIEISHVCDMKMSLLQRTSPSINSPLFKKRSISTGLKCK